MNIIVPQHPLHIFMLKLLDTDKHFFIIYPCIVTHLVSTSTIFSLVKLNLISSDKPKTVLFRPRLLWVASSNKFKVIGCPTNSSKCYCFSTCHFISYVSLTLSSSRIVCFSPFYLQLLYDNRCPENIDGMITHPLMWLQFQIEFCLPKRHPGKLSKSSIYEFLLHLSHYTKSSQPWGRMLDSERWQETIGRA